MVILCFVCMSELTLDLLHKMLNISHNITLTIFIKLENKIAYNAIRNNTSIIGNKYINISSTLFKNRFLSMRDYKNIWFYYHDF